MEREDLEILFNFLSEVPLAMVKETILRAGIDPQEFYEAARALSEETENDILFQLDELE